MVRCRAGPPWYDSSVLGPCHQLRLRCASWVAVACVVSGCAAREPACVPSAETPTATPPHPPAARAPVVGGSAATPRAPVAPSPADPETDVSGTWLWSCCDDAQTWIGMLVLVRSGTVLHGGFLTDGDGGHASYVEGTVDGDHVRLARRWYTAGLLHEQLYDLVQDARGGRLVGTFTEPAFEPKAHRIRIERGFSPLPRRGAEAAPPTDASGSREIVKARDDASRAWERKRSERPCDCKLVCYCGGVPPGREHQEESVRCGDQCRCPICPPLP